MNVQELERVIRKYLEYLTQTYLLPHYPNRSRFVSAVELFMLHLGDNGYVTMFEVHPTMYTRDVAGRVKFKIPNDPQFYTLDYCVSDAIIGQGSF